MDNDPSSSCMRNSITLTCILRLLSTPIFPNWKASSSNTLWQGLPLWCRLKHDNTSLFLSGFFFFSPNLFFNPGFPFTSICGSSNMNLCTNLVLPEKLVFIKKCEMGTSKHGEEVSAKQHGSGRRFESRRQDHVGFLSRLAVTQSWECHGLSGRLEPGSWTWHTSLCCL